MQRWNANKKSLCTGLPYSPVHFSVRRCAWVSIHDPPPLFALQCLRILRPLSTRTDFQHLGVHASGEEPGSAHVCALASPQIPLCPASRNCRTRDTLHWASLPPSSRQVPDTSFCMRNMLCLVDLHAFLRSLHEHWLLLSQACSPANPHAGRGCGTMGVVQTSHPGNFCKFCVDQAPAPSLL